MWKQVKTMSYFNKYRFYNGSISRDDRFDMHVAANVKFWDRIAWMGGGVVHGKICCDIGCGSGSLAIDMANKGTTRVIGVDIKNDTIAFAKENLARRFPHLVDVVEFYCLDFRELDMTFDIITSQNACEHIFYLKEMLISIKEKLNENGLFFASFGPLWNSFNGDHNNKPIRIPWSHLLVRPSKEKMSKMAGGLNGLSFAEYKEIFYGSGLEVLSFKTNQGRHPIYKLFSLLSHISIIREYFTSNIAVVLKKTQ